ncbi:MAG TPA: NUDIX hydrolase [Roseiflexaceae bacterium]|nr:NUDIX hydrolase [Roseiflexaceae bacterium]
MPIGEAQREYRAAIAALVEAIRPLDDLERQHCATALQWIHSGAPLCRTARPATPPRHLVSYFVVYDPAAQAVLLVDHRQAGLWLPSGGHVEPGEHPRDTVVREALEELQLAAQFLIPEPLLLTVTETVGTTAGHTDVSLWYVVRGDATQQLCYDPGEFHSVAWFAAHAVPLQRADPHMGRFLAKLPRGLARI